MKITNENNLPIDDLIKKGAYMSSKSSALITAAKANAVLGSGVNQIGKPQRRIALSDVTNSSILQTNQNRISNKIKVYQESDTVSTYRPQQELIVIDDDVTEISDTEEIEDYYIEEGEYCKSPDIEQDIQTEEEEEEDNDEFEDSDESHLDIHHGFEPYRLATNPNLTNSISQELKAVNDQFTKKGDLLDEEDEDIYDISMVAEYSEDIFKYMRRLEAKMRPIENYMEFQEELEWRMRSILVDWLVQVHLRFNLLPETLFLTVNYIDRFLSRRSVSLSKLQMVGAVALFLAAKYEEINCPSIEEIAYMVDHTYSIDELLRAERFMIDVLDFEMGWPGPMSFLRRTSKADDYDLETRSLAKYFLEITIMDQRFISLLPSWLAAASHYLARKLLAKGDWTTAHVYYSGYTSRQLQPIAQILLECCQHAGFHHKAIFEKYQERRYKRASTFVQEWMKMVDNV